MTPCLKCCISFTSPAGSLHQALSGRTKESCSEKARVFCLQHMQKQMQTWRICCCSMAVRVRDAGSVIVNPLIMGAEN